MEDMKQQQHQKQKHLANEESKKKERHIVTWTQEVHSSYLTIKYYY